MRYDGKRMRLTPFALIMKSSDGKNTKTITSDRAVFDLNEPLSFNVNPDGEPLKIKHAHLEPNVEIRDDKGTPSDPSDDMRIGPLTTVDYDEALSRSRPTPTWSSRIRTWWRPAIGMLIQLRKDDESQPGGSSAGFRGGGKARLAQERPCRDPRRRQVGHHAVRPRPRGAHQGQHAGQGEGPRSSRSKEGGGRSQPTNRRRWM